MRNNKNPKLFLVPLLIVLGAVNTIRKPFII